MKVETKAIIQEVPVYIADDGTEFNTEAECRDYEVKNEMKPKIEKAEKLRIIKLDNVMPLIDEELNEDHTYIWYKLTNENDFRIVNEAYI